MTVHYDQAKTCPSCKTQFFWDDEENIWAGWVNRKTCSTPCQRQRDNDRRREKAIVGSSQPPTVSETDSRWRHKAACRGENPELWFPVGTTGPALLQTNAAKTICRSCPVIDECRSWALGSGSDAGIWGGLTEDERRALKRRQSRTRARTA